MTKNIALVCILIYLCYFFIDNCTGIVKHTHIIKSTNDSLKINFVRSGGYFKLSGDDVDSSFIYDERKLYYQKIINKLFKPNHLFGINQIALSNKNYVNGIDTEDGCCAYIYNDNIDTVKDSCYIIISVYSADDEETLLHEICHAMMFMNPRIINGVKEQWVKYDVYVSSYAKTSFEEDFAETGAYYLMGRRGSNNPKFKLFKKVFDKIGE